MHVAVDRSRHLIAPEGVRVHRRVRLDERSLWGLAPPRQRYDDAALEVALGRDDPLEAIEVLARAVQHRRTTAQRLADALAGRPSRLLVLEGWRGRLPFRPGCVAPRILADDRTG